MVGRLGWACAVLLAVSGCSGRHTFDLPRGESAAVHNAIEFGLSSSTFFVVSRVDGAVVHDKFDRDRVVAVPIGRHRLSVRFYSESLTEARHGAGECSLDLVAAAGSDYYLEGAVESTEWRARLVDAAGANDVPCLFDDGAQRGAVVGGTQRHAVSARPAIRRGVAPAAAVAPASRAPAAVAGGEVVSPSVVVVPAVAAPAVAPVVAANAEPSRETDGFAPESEVRPAAAAPAFPAPDERGESSIAMTLLHGRGHWGCPSGRFRVSAVENGTLALGGSVRVRLLGIQPQSAASYAGVLERLIDECVGLDFDPFYARAGHRDRDGNLLAYVEDDAGSLINAEAIRLGVATVDTQVRCRRLGELLAAQAEARGAKGVPPDHSNGETRFP